LKPVISLSKAAELIGMDRSNFRKEIVEKRKFTEDEAYQVGKLWFITMDGLKRVYGNRLKEEQSK
jgi:hypothetical protein